MFPPRNLTLWMLRIVVCASALMGWTAFGHVEMGRPLMRTYGPREVGSGDSMYWSSAQDERGVMYFGSDVVNSYDGERWKQYSVPGGVVRSLSIGEAGRLWIGALNEVGYFDRKANGELGTYRSLIPHLPENRRQLGDVWHVFARPDGAVFVTADAVVIWDSGEFQVHPLPGERRLPAFQAAGRIFVNQRSVAIWEVVGRELRPVLSADTLQHAGSLWLEPAAEGWFAVTTQGLMRLSGDTHSSEVVAPEASAFISNNVVTTARRARNGDLFVGTLAGVAVVDREGSLKRVLTENDGLPSRSILSLLEASDGGLWITSGAGITRVAIESGTSFFGPDEGLKGTPIHSIAQRSSDILAATDNGVFRLPTTEDDRQEFQPVPEMPSRYVSLVTHGSSIFAAGYKGVYRMSNDGTIDQVYSTKQDATLLQPSDASPATLLAGDSFSIVRVSEIHSEQPSANVIAQLTDLPLVVAEDGANRIWTGTGSRGAFRLAGHDTGNIQPVEVRGHPYSGRALVGRIGQGVAVCTVLGIEIHDPDHAAPLQVPNAPTTNPLAISNADPAGRLWLAYASRFSDGTRVAGLGRLSRSDAGVVWTPFATPGIDQVGNVSRLYVDDRGILWVGGMEALLRIDPTHLQPTVPPRAPLLSGSIPELAEVPPDENTVTFHFSAVEYGRREAVRFQTRLSDEAEWSAPTNNDHLTLAGLSDGHYGFAVRLINDAGMAGPATTWRFTVLPPWYRTRTALTAWAAMIVVAFVGGIHWRSAYLRRQNLRLEALVRKKTDQLEQANNAKSEFIANMSHEIRNPISGIVGLSLALEETPLAERQKQLADSIRSCAALLATLVDDVLDFSKIEAGKIELRIAPFELRASLQQCAAMVAEEARNAGITFEFSVPPEIPDRVVGDSARIQQIVLNYLTNAVKFGGGKPVVIGATSLVPGRIRLFVRDHGPGMSAAEASSLFTKFTRLERARTQNIRGSGLGLAVCRLLATKMGGGVGVESQIGEGSCFWTELPLPLANAPETRADTTAPAAAPLHALIVEDMDYNAAAMQAVLRKLGITSDVAADGPTALRKLRSDRYDVVFMDWNLPGMIGTEVVSRYRAVEPPDRRTIIIATTAYSAAFNQEACLQAGMDAFIAKPFTPEKISAALRDLRGPLRAAASVEVSRPLGVPPAPPIAAAAELDLQMLRILGEETEPGLAMQIERYLAAYEAERAAAHAAIRSGDPKEIHRTAHRLVSQATIVKYEPLAQLASQLQAQSATAEPERLARLLEQFDAEFARLRSKLDSIRASLAPA